jgi:hypothetical protein
VKRFLVSRLVLEHTEHHDFRFLILLGNPFEHLETVLARHFDIQQHRVGIGIKLAIVKLPSAREVGNGILAIAGVPDDLKTAAVIQSARQKECVVLRVLDHHNLSQALRHTSSTANPLRC